jgi:hypothetical protein
MKKKHYTNVVIFVLLIFSSILIFGYIKTPNEATQEDYVPITIQHSQYFDSLEGKIITGSNKGIASGDFRWEATGYQYGGEGSINSTFMISMHPYKDITVSRLKKIENTDFDSNARSTCSKVDYDRSEEQIIRVNDGDVFCLSLDKNRDGVFGDSYLKLKIKSHTDSSEGNYADSMTFIYKVL